MKTFYSVIDKYESTERIVIIGSKESKIKPKDSYKSIRNVNVYINWFDTLEQAEAFAESLLNEEKGM